jgi:hypothetical protein
MIKISRGCPILARLLRKGWDPTVVGQHDFHRPLSEATLFENFEQLSDTLDYLLVGGIRHFFFWVYDDWVENAILLVE